MRPGDRLAPMSRAPVRTRIVECLYFLWLVAGLALVFTFTARWIPFGIGMLVLGAAFNRRHQPLRNGGADGTCTAAQHQFWGETGVWAVCLLAAPALLVSGNPAVRGCGLVITMAGLANAWFAHDCDAEKRGAPASADTETHTEGGTDGA